VSSRAVKLATLAYALLLPLSTVLLAASLRGYGFARAAVGCMFLASIAHLALAFSPPAVRIRSTLIVGPALVAALVLLAIPPPLSDDVYRYLFDGVCVSNGFSPFAHAPSSAKVADLVAALPGRINHPDLPTIYPPFAQFLFGIIARAGLGIMAWKILLLGCLAGGAVLTRARKARIGSVDTGAWVFSHPLALFTAAGNGNVDVVGVLLIAGVCWAIHHRREWVVGGLIGLAAGVKLFPLGLFTARLGRDGIPRALTTLLVGGLVLGILYSPVAASGLKAFGSLGRYAESWDFNASGHSVLTSTLDSALSATGVTDSVRVGTNAEATYYNGTPTFDDWRSRRELASGMAKLLGVAVTGLIVLVCWRRRMSFEASTSWILSSLFLTAAVVHPWYLLWVLIPATMSGHRFGLAWCAAVTAAFWAPAVMLDGGIWTDPVWVRCLEYGFAAVFAVIPWASLTLRP
jgi:hypothetical protein